MAAFTLGAKSGIRDVFVTRNTYPLETKTGNSDNSSFQKKERKTPDCTVSYKVSEVVYDVTDDVRDVRMRHRENLLRQMCVRDEIVDVTVDCITDSTKLSNTNIFCHISVTSRDTCM